uniref:Transmembrane protein n=1 Tax=Nelumbo nucifera TaxID=4432 RepID=A0A822Z001_NELNU|nr:TPA_asm: hypothetical protein HUJ06_008953 [Nelumbo nucifera]
MDNMTFRDKDLAVDLESGGTTSEEEGSKEPVSSTGQTKNLLGKVWNGFVNFDGSVKGEDGISSWQASNSGEFSIDNLELVTDKKSGGEEAVELLEKKVMKEKRKKTSSKKPPKPPRPPRGPSLDAADLKLVKEISELAMLKRARVERMKALKRMKAAKASSSNSNLYAMIITILFCLVILFQVQYYKNISASGANGSVSASPMYVTLFFCGFSFH